MEDELGLKLIFFSPWTFVFLVLIIILGNLLLIDCFIFVPQEASKTSTSQNIKPITVTSTKTVQTDQDCLDNCKKEIETAVANALKPQDATLQNSKEFYIPLGTGSSTSIEWVDVPGVQAYIDSTSYLNIKTVTFEASLYTPTANQEATARLYDITDGHPVWNSDVNIESNNHELKISSPISLDKGSKLYQVQMKTQLGSRTNLENARVHIITY